MNKINYNPNTVSETVLSVMKEMEDELATKDMSKWPMQKLTIELIREKYWNPVTKTCKPIKYISEQFYNGFMPEEEDFEELIFTGALITGTNKKTTDWLSLRKYGPYEKNGKNGRTFYYLETVNNMPDTNENKVQIGWCGVDLTKDISDIDDPEQLINNYITEDALDGVNLWVLKE